MEGDYLKVSPIFYMGNKKRLIQKGLIDLFPDNINTFYDLFGGSGVVSLNVKANKYILNELDNCIFDLYNTLKQFDNKSIVQHIKKRIKEYDLPTKNTNSTTTSKEEREYYKKHYMEFRKQYNINKNPLDLFVLMNYCLSQTMRFNSKGDFNMPFGNNRFIEEKHGQYYKDFHEFINQDNVNIYNKSYIDFDIDEMIMDDFVYLDPPYIGTTATYNENGKWDNKQQNDLITYCNSLIHSNIRFAMSNVFKNKDFVNEDLIIWSESKNLNVFTFDGFSYHSYGKGDAKTKEVLITNY